MQMNKSKLKIEKPSKLIIFYHLSLFLLILLSCIYQILILIVGIFAFLVYNIIILFDLYVFSLLLDYYCVVFFLGTIFEVIIASISFKRIRRIYILIRFFLLFLLSFYILSFLFLSFIIFVLAGGGADQLWVEVFSIPILILVIFSFIPVIISFNLKIQDYYNENNETVRLPSIIVPIVIIIHNSRHNRKRYIE